MYAVLFIHVHHARLYGNGKRILIDLDECVCVCVWKGIKGSMGDRHPLCEVILSGPRRHHWGRTNQAHTRTGFGTWFKLDKKGAFKNDVSSFTTTMGKEFTLGGRGTHLMWAGVEISRLRDSRGSFCMNAPSLFVPSSNETLFFSYCHP
jgi:hypothetical protein